MKLSDIKKSSEGRWYLITGEQVEEDKVPEGVPAFLICRPTPGDLRRMNRESKKSRFMGRRSVKVDDTEKLQKLLLNHCVQDWKNIEGDDGEPFPCNDDSRETLDSVWSKFSSLWTKIATANEDEDDDFVVEEELGN